MSSWTSGSAGRLVALQVRLQAVALSEAFPAGAALVRPLAVVRPHVDGQVGLAGAGFPADAADEGLGARVDGQVVVQVGLPLEGPAAVRAAVRRLPRVHAHVHRQRPPGGEAPPTLLAVEGLLVGVRPHVDEQLLAGQEHLAADVAQERALPVGVDLLVLLQRGGQLEAPPTHLAGVGSLRRVGLLVARQGAVVAEDFAANAAHVGLGFGASSAVSLQLLVRLEEVLRGGESGRSLLRVCCCVIAAASIRQESLCADPGFSFLSILKICLDQNSCFDGLIFTLS